MPYIKPTERKELLRNEFKIAWTPGELNFLISTTVADYLRVKGLTYQTINDVLGALEGAKLEFYRRVAVPYENTKLAQNGDVYP